MSTEGVFSAPSTSQDAYSNYENPAFKVRLRDIRNTGVEPPENLNTTDYSKDFHAGNLVIGKKWDQKDKEVYKGTILRIQNDERGNVAMIIIRTPDNIEIELDPDTVIKSDIHGEITDTELLNYKSDDFYSPGPYHDIADTPKLVGESNNRIIKTFEQFKNGL